MEALKAALPSAFDPEHEKKNGDEEAARELYDKCEKELQNIASAQATPTPKRERGAESTEAKYAGLSNPFIVITGAHLLGLGPSDPKRNTKPLHSRQKNHKFQKRWHRWERMRWSSTRIGAPSRFVEQSSHYYGFILHLSDPFEWSVDDVVKWAVEYVGVSRKNANKLREQEIDGAHLPDLTAEMMVKLCGISAAAAVDIMNHLPDLFPSTPIADAPGPLLHLEPMATSCDLGIHCLLRTIVLRSLSAPFI